MNEDRDRPLGRQQVSGMLDDFIQSVQVGIVECRFKQRGIAGGIRLHVCH